MNKYFNPLIEYKQKLSLELGVHRTIMAMHEYSTPPDIKKCSHKNQYNLVSYLEYQFR